MSVTLLSIRWR